MRGTIRGVAYSSLVLLGVMAAWLTWTTADAGSRYADDPRNVRALQGPVEGDRGRILTSDGVVLAESVDKVRSYPERSLYAHLVGFEAAGDIRGLERTRYRSLSSRDDGSITAWLLGLGDADLGPPDLHLTVDHTLQLAAHDALGGRTGAVVAIDVETGAVLAYVSEPSFDPNEVVAGLVDPQDIEDQVLDRVADRVLPPGSTFKVLMAAAALADGATPESEYEDAREYLAPGAGVPVGNADGRFCGNGESVTLIDALVVSCNAVFARLAVDLGGAAVNGAAERAGFNRALPWETGAVISSIPAASALDSDLGALAQTGIGERDVRVTPLQMAVIAAAIGNDGVAMRPFVVSESVAPDGEILERTDPESFRRFFDEPVASDLLLMMEQVVERGTGTAARIEGLRVAGKTGTAEGSGGPHAWFISLAPADDPAIAIAVIVESGGSGGRIAAPIAAAVLRTWSQSGS